MELDYTPIYIGVGVGVGALVAWKLRKAEPLIDVGDAVYHKDKKKLKVHLSNATPQPVYAKPLVRKIVTPSKKKEEDDDSPFSFMPASRDTRRTMYELVSECDEKIQIPGNSSIDLVFHLPEDHELGENDRIQVDSICGIKEDELKASVLENLPVSVKEGEVVAKNPVDLIDSDKLIHEVKKQDSIEPVLKAHPHLSNLVEVIEEDLKPIHGIILHLLEVEHSLTTGDLSERLDKSRSTINRHLKLLHENNLLHRYREGRGFRYMSLKRALNAAECS